MHTNNKLFINNTFLNGKSVFKNFLIILILLIASQTFYSGSKFPKPDFESNYTIPEEQQISPRSDIWEYIDTMILVFALRSKYPSVSASASLLFKVSNDSFCARPHTNGTPL